MAVFGATFPRILSAPVLSGMVPLWLREMFFGHRRASLLPLDDALAECAPQNAPLLDVILPLSMVLRRSVKVGVLKQKDWHAAAALDLANKTPFSAADVEWALGPSDDALGQTVNQWVAKTHDLDALDERLAQNGWTVRRMLLQAGTSQVVLRNQSRATLSATRWQTQVNLALAIITLFGLGVAWIAPSFQARATARDLSAELVALQSETISLRQQLDQVAAQNELRAQFLANVTTQTKTVSLLRDTTVYLPDAAWLSEWRYGPSGLKLIGETSDSAAELVLQIGQKARGWSPALSGAVSRSPNGAERFSIDVSLSGARK